MVQKFLLREVSFGRVKYIYFFLQYWFFYASKSLCLLKMTLGTGHIKIIEVRKICFSSLLCGFFNAYSNYCLLKIILSTDHEQNFSHQWELYCWTFRFCEMFCLWRVFKVIFSKQSFESFLTIAKIFIVTSHFQQALKSAHHNGDKKFQMFSLWAMSKSIFKRPWF